MIRLICSVVGVYACFLTWGVLQEWVTTTGYGIAGEKFRHFVFLNMCQSIVASVVAVVYVKLWGGTLSSFKWPGWKLMSKYAQVTLTNVLASPFGYASLKHINYPTLTLGKSSKLVPVMFMNMVLYRRRYPWIKYLSVILITVGVSYFALLNSNNRSRSTVTSNSIYGLALLAVNLLLDGVTNSTQDQMFRTLCLTGYQMMFFINFLGTGFMMLYLLIVPFAGNELLDAWNFCILHPAVLQHILLFCMCGATGQCFIFYLLENYGSLVLVTVTVTRKLFTMLLSVFLFGHKLSVWQWGAVALVFMGIALDSASKRKTAEKDN